MGYMAVFVRSVTRDIHLKLVIEASIKAHARASTVAVTTSIDIYSGCKTNFVGANRELRNFMKFVTADITQETIQRYSCDHGERWHFNPSSAI
jgi:hypothetical protein